MNNLFDNLARLGEQARGETLPPDSEFAGKVLRKIISAEPAEPRWPIMALTAGYAVAACVAMMWVFSAYGVITHPLLQFFNTVALATF
jgi:hypothetical protein